MSSIDKYAVLKEYFGHTCFRPGQEELIDTLLAGGDALGVMPTGAGKSLCYQIPALLLPGITLVISPLISLMKDQVAALGQAGVAAAFINSSLSDGQYKEVFRRAGDGRYKIIYIAPERLLSGDFLRFVAGCDISLVAVDEAHCVSQWGQDFRPSYLQIKDFIRQLPVRPAVGAFTATATVRVKEDICRLLELERPLDITTGFDRANLFFQVLKPKNKTACYLELVSQRRDKSGIIYCATRKATESVCAQLVKEGYPATRYHAGLSDEERRRNQEDFVHDRRPIMVATNAFGMGIDKSNVSYVIHYNMPKNLESYYQEAGRAGRDGAPADCVLLYSPGDVITAKTLIQNSRENENLTAEQRSLVEEGDLVRLELMVEYCKTGSCLRSYILNYFGEDHPLPCGNCGNCRADLVAQDITVEAQKILSCVVRGERLHPLGLGMTMYVRTLHGSKEQRVLSLGLDKLPTWGALGEASRYQIREYIDCLLRQGYLFLTAGPYPVLRPAASCEQVLFHGQKVIMEVLAQPPEAKIEAAPSRKGKATPAPASPADSRLLAALKELRTRLAKEAGVPAYIIFTDATLNDMAARRPASAEEFLAVSGVGAVKARRYGMEFLAVIEEYAR